MQEEHFNVFEQQMRGLEERGVISLLTCHPQLPGFYFNLGKLKKINGVRLYTDMSKHSYKLIFRNGEPHVYPIPYQIPKGKHSHINVDLSLCLYHRKEFNWADHPFLDQYIIPWTFMWQVYFNEWLKTGQWPGPEFKH